jgi:mannose-6-phosphate isomerase-like protein (cupin superfamily)
MTESGLQNFDLARLVEMCEKRDAPYLEFLRVPQLSCGIYQLTAGGQDHQTSHDEDEVYFILKGKGRMVSGGAEQEIGPGSIVYVPADTDHEFFRIDEDLSMLVFFGSGGPSGAAL